MWFLFLSTLVFIQPAFMVKPSDFKTCAQSFCQRIRDVSQILNLNPQTLELNPTQGSLSAQVIAPSLNLTLSITTLADSCRIKMTPEKPSYPLYESSFSIHQLPDSVPFEILSKDSSQLVIGFSSYKVSITFASLSIVVSKENTNILVFNDKNLFTFEHSAVPLVLNDPSNHFEESFNGKRDTRPKGPSAIAFDVSFPGSSHVYGLPEHASDFSLKSTRSGKEYSEPFRLYNLDVFEYILDSPMALYGSVPFLMSHKKDHSSAVFWLNSAEMWVDVEKSADSASFISKFFKNNEPSVSTHWMAESGVLDVFFLLGSKPTDIFNSFTKLTGRPQLPQLFSIGYHQCRWNYNDQDDVETVNQKFDEYDIPYDVLWLDIEHTDQKKYFTWDYSKFPRPEEMQRKLASHGRKMVTIIDPHIKKDSSFDVYSKGIDGNLFVKTHNGDNYEGWCWPGHSHWLDYTNPAAREMWARKFLDYPGSTPTLYTWNDMNEPSVFTGPEITMSKDCIHYGNVEHRDVHNVYGMLQQRATYEGHLLRSNNTDRPFILSRAFFAGTQRYGAIWTGDNFAQWDHLEASVPMLLSIGISGIVFSGADVGGFFGNPEPELLVRWYQVGAFQPFFRGHAHIDTARREPWLFGEPYTSLIRNAIRTRYALLPYIYTAFHEASVSGNPVMRPLLSEFPSDEATFGLGNQFMLGSGILVKPVVQKDQAFVDVYLPKETIWYDYKTLQHITTQNGVVKTPTPMESIPVFLRGGVIIPRRQRIRRSATLMQKDPFTLVVALDSNEYAKGSIYLDDGKSFGYEKGEYVSSEFEFSRHILEGTKSSSSLDMLATLSQRVERVIVTGLKKVPKAIQVDSRKCSFIHESIGSGLHMIVIKDPKVIIGEAWKIMLLF